MDFSNLDLLKEKLEQYRPLPDAAIRNLHDDLVLRWTYHSNAIEGNTLTLKETKVRTGRHHGWWQNIAGTS